MTLNNRQTMRIAWFDSSSKNSFSDYYRRVIEEVAGNLLEIDCYNSLCLSQNRHYLKAVSIHERNQYDAFVYNLDDDIGLNYCRLIQGIVPGHVLYHTVCFRLPPPDPLTCSPMSVLLKEIVSGKDYRWSKREVREINPPYGFDERIRAIRAICVNERIAEEINRLSSCNFSSLVDDSNSKCIPCVLPYPVHNRNFLSEFSVKEAKIAVLGGGEIEFRLRKVLRAIRRAGVAHTVHVFNLDGSKRVDEIVSASGLEVDRVLVHNRDIDRWCDLCRRSDIAMLPRFSLYSSLGPFLPLALASGCMTIVNDFGDGAFLPDNVVFKVRLGRDEEEELVALLKMLSSMDREVKDGLRSQCVQFARETYMADMICTELYQLLREDVPLTRNVWDRFAIIRREAKRYVLNRCLSSDGGLLRSAFGDIGWINTA